MHHFQQNGIQNPILSLIEDAKFLPLLKLFCFSRWIVAISLEMGCCWYHFMLSQNLIFYINEFFSGELSMKWFLSFSILSLSMWLFIVNQATVRVVAMGTPLLRVGDLLRDLADPPFSASPASLSSSSILSSSTRPLSCMCKCTLQSLDCCIPFSYIFPSFNFEPLSFFCWTFEWWGCMKEAIYFYFRASNGKWAHWK
jgi:hypothetical protein